MYFYITDEHYLHKNIIRFCKRPFSSMDEMIEVMVENHNKVVGKKDTTVHGGDFCFATRPEAEKIIKRLNGNHIFIKGGHDYWLKKSAPQILTQKINKRLIITCHYPMESWLASFHGSIHIHGHSHRVIPLRLNRINMCADLNNFTPKSIDQILEEIEKQNELLGDI